MYVAAGHSLPGMSVSRATTPRTRTRPCAKQGKHGRQQPSHEATGASSDICRSCGASTGRLCTANVVLGVMCGGDNECGEGNECRMSACREVCTP